MCSVIEQFIKQAINSPDNIAIIYGTRKITYQQLDQYSDRLCWQLQQAGIGRGHNVPLLAEPSPEFIIGLLGISKCGAGYIPLDSHTSPDRLAYIIGQSGSPAIVCCRKGGATGITSPGQRIVQVDQSPLTTIVPVSYNLPGANNVAYVIFTCETAGSPQGVMISHAALHHMISWHNQHFDLDSLSRGALCSAPDLDVAQCEVWSPLVCGAMLVLPQNNTVCSKAAALQHFLADHAVTHAFIPGALVADIVSLPQPVNLALRYMFIVGAKWNPVNLKRINYQLISYYGPPETTLLTTCNPVVCASKNPLESIGLPVAGAEVFILNEQLQPVTDDTPGEIFIAGPGLALGYLNNNRLTNEKFITPACAQGKRLYRSGARARWLPDGRIQYLGHINTQLMLSPHPPVADRRLLRTLKDDIYLASDISIKPWFDEYQIRAPRYIFLTGATGFVGSHLLQDLLHSTDAHIYCLVRSQSAVHGWIKLHDTLAHNCIFLSDEHLARVHVLAGDLAEPWFGLPRDTWQRISYHTDIVYHCAGAVNLAQPYSCMKRDNVLGLREMIRFAANVRTKPLVLLSALSVYSWDYLHTGKRVMREDDSIDDNLPAVISDSGFVRSKWVMEKMADLAAAQGLPLMTFRLGYAICHSQTGVSAWDQWWAGLVKTCIDTGSVPLLHDLREGLTTVDYATHAISYISRNPQALRHKFNLVHETENNLTLNAFFSLLERYFDFRFLPLPFGEWLSQWDRNTSSPLYPLLSWFKDKMIEGQSAVQLYQGGFLGDCCNVKHFLQGSDIHEPVFTRELLARYLCHTIGH